jgi:hypothetical protein
LGFKTPAEVLHQSLKRVALRTWIRPIFNSGNFLICTYLSVKIHWD